MDNTDLGPQRRVKAHKSVRTKLLIAFTVLFTLAFLAAGLVSIKGLPFSSFDGWEGNARREAVRNLNLIADLKKERLMFWFRERRADAQVIAENRIITANLPRLLSTVRTFGSSDGNDNGPWLRIRNKDAFKQIAAFLSSVQNAYARYRTARHEVIRIVDPGTGLVVVSTNDAEIGSALDHGKSLIEIVRNGKNYVSDVSSRDRRSVPHIDVAHPVINRKGAVIGIVVLEIITEDAFGPFLHAGSGLGETGEALLVDESGRSLTSLRFPLADGSLAKVLEHKITSKPAIFAASGREGTIESADYRGHEVIAAYRHIRISPGWGWGMVVKIDRAQLFASVNDGIISSIWIGVTGLLLVVVLTLVLTRKLIRPLRQMAKVATRLAAGDRSVRTRLKTDDEIGVLSSVFDIMADNFERSLSDAETLYSSVIEQAADAIFLIEFPSGRFVEVNNQACKALGYSNDELLTLSVPDIDPNIPKDKFSDFVASLSEGVPQTTESVHRRKDGSSFEVEIGTGLIELGDRKLILSIARDISERKKAEAQLRQAQKMEAIGQLTGGVAHDFNNLLAVIIGNVEMVEDRIQGDKMAQHHIEALTQAVDRASSLTGRLLAFSRQQTLAPKSTDISGLVDGLDDMLRRTLGETINLRTKHSSDLWPAMLDPSQLEHALVNLSVNARDAMPGGGSLTIETANIALDETYAGQHEEVTPGDYVMVAVSDTGTGMPPEVLEKVFEPFFTTKGMGEGSGLGLSMVYGFVKQSNGHITIYSEVGDGTTVKLYMPRSKEAVAEEDIKGDIPEIALGSERILVVEDDENVREVAVTILRDQGYEVVEAGDGKEAIQHLKHGQPFDLLFTDVVLPGGMNGVEIAEEAKRRQPNIKVLHTTGYAENAVVHDGKLNPDVTLVNKPYRRAELLEKFRAVLDGDEGVTKPFIIVVDDDAGIRDMVSTAAAEWGYEVAAVESVEEFLALFAARQPDAIILDIVMPQTHGIALLETLQQSQSQAAIIMITGYGQSYLDSAAKMINERKLNLAGAFRKPLRLADLKEALRNAIPI